MPENLSPYRQALLALGFLKGGVGSNFETYERREHDGNVVHVVHLRASFEPPPLKKVAVPVTAPVPVVIPSGKVSKLTTPFTSDGNKPPVPNQYTKNFLRVQTKDQLLKLCTTCGIKASSDAVKDDLIILLMNQPEAPKPDA